ncbi:MAG: hypothetical protein IT266_04470 [Saprospiraceae bacterium]|nr:hypothetical protein [Saprospiraceae bacterium]
MTYSCLPNALISLCLCALIACDAGEEPQPAYLSVDPIQFEVRSHEGSANQHLPDAWIYVGSRYAGAYELPVRIPVLANQVEEVLILPGYRLNGSISSPARAALLEPYRTEVQFIPGQDVLVTPSCGYQANLKFPFLESFEGNHFFNDDRDGDPETRIVASLPEEAFEGVRAGKIELRKEHPKLRVAYDIPKEIPQSPDPILLELHFKSDIPFSIGFLGNKGGAVEDDLIRAVLLPKKTWTKVYFDFREIVNLSNAQSYRLAIDANFQQDSTLDVQRIYLDNIKVVHR